MDVARHFDMQSIFLVRAIFWLRAKAMGATAAAASPLPTLGLDALQSMGWGVLDEQPGRYYIAGASCQPWLADVVFTPIPPDAFAGYAEPERVKIVWTLEAEPLGEGGGECRFATETRAAGTDAAARAKFRRYWRLARFGIVAIRLLLVPAIRRRAERRSRPAEGT
jgi:hypothetical protein